MKSRIINIVNKYAFIYRKNKYGYVILIIKIHDGNKLVLLCEITLFILFDI